MEYYLIIFLLVGFFYVGVPAAGAFYVRSRWRLFRRQIVQGSLFPIAEYRQLRAETDGYIGNFRFFGELEAIQGDDVVWLRDHGNSVSAEVKRVSVYWLPSFSTSENEGREERNDETLPDEMPVRVPWHRIFSLPEGTRMFVSGPLYSVRGKGVFRSTKDIPLTLVIYDGTKESILRRVIWGARQRNEYWNPFTPGSLMVGSFGMIILAYILLRGPLFRLPGILSLTAGIFPILPLLPPGILLFFLYRSWWKRARFLRAERDMVVLPLRHFPRFSGEEDQMIASTANGEALFMKRFSDLKTATSALGEGQIRPVMRLGRRARIEPNYYIFGGAEDGVAGPLRRPADPMAELVLIPGNPVELSEMCSRTARRYELLATGAFTVAILINLYVVLFVLGSIVR